MKKLKKLKVVKKKKKPFPTIGSYAYIPKGLHKFCIPIDLIQGLENNPNVNKFDDSIQRLAKLIKRNGFRKPIVIDQDYKVRAGNHAFEAALLLKMEFIPVAQSEWFTEEEATDFVITDNTANTFTDFDDKALLKLMNQKLIVPEQSKDLGFEQRKLFKIKNFSDVTNRENSEEDYSVFSKEEISSYAYKIFRKKGFPYPHLFLFECMQEINKLAALNDATSINSNLGYKVADTFHKHRFSGHAENMRSPIESFKIDKSLKKALKMELTDNSNNLHYKSFGNLMLVNGTQACSNFRPGFAKVIYNTYCKEDGVVFDPSTGYGGRYVGFLASHCSKYIGVDPSLKTHEANLKLSKILGKHKQSEFYHRCFEEFNPFHLGMNNTVDLVFTSPPYFCKEIYSDEKTQSRSRYKTYKVWYEKFLIELLKRCMLLLKNECYCIINIQDIKAKNKIIPLVDDTKKAAKEQGFTFVKEERFELAHRKGVKAENESENQRATEAVLFFKK